MKSLFVTSILLLILGAISLLIEGIYYGDIDDEGFIQDSLFLPLGAGMLLLGGTGLLLGRIVRHKNETDGGNGATRP